MAKTTPDNKPLHAGKATADGARPYKFRYRDTKMVKEGRILVRGKNGKPPTDADAQEVAESFLKHRAEPTIRLIPPVEPYWDWDSDRMDEQKKGLRAAE